MNYKNSESPARIDPLPLTLRAAAIALVFGTTAQAQAQSTTKPPAEATLPPVQVTATPERDNSIGTVGGKFETPLRDIPQTVNVLDRKMLDAQAATSLKDALRNVPGITLGAGEGGVIGDNINLRGFSARSDIYTDGMRDRGQYSRDIFSLEAVEVLKGPSSMMYGRGSTGGVINQVSKRPDAKAHGEATVTVGTDDTYRATADINQPLGEGIAARIAVFGQDMQSTRDVVRNKDWGVAPSVRFGLGTQTTFTLSALIQRNNDIPDYGFPFLPASNEVGSIRKPVDAPRNFYYGYTDDNFDQSVNVYTAIFEHQFSPTLKMRNSTLANSNRTDASPSPLAAPLRTDLTRLPVASDPLSEVVALRQDRDRILRDKSFVNQTDFKWKTRSGSVAHTVTTGIEIAREENREDRYVWNTLPEDAAVNLGNPVAGPRSGDRALSRKTQTTADTLAAYINDQIDLTPQWKLVAGLRGERFSVESTLTKLPLPPGFLPDTTESSPPKSETMWSPRAGVLFQPSKAESYYASWGVSHNPSAENVSQSSSSAALDAEKNQSFEVGAKLDVMGGDLSLTGALFHTVKTNARFRDPVDPTVQVLDGKIRVQGLEVGATGYLSPAWQVYGGYTLMDGKIVDSPEIGTTLDMGLPAEGSPAPNVPRHSATLWTWYRLSPSWEVGGGALYSSDRTLNNYGTAKIDGYTRLDATLAYLQKSYELRLNLQNLTDAEYFEGSSGGRATPVRGQTALLTATFRY